jgi:vacuolar-type H+-ATPase subunit I/STV1
MEVSNALSLSLSQDLATMVNAPEIACTSGDHTILLTTMVWIALLLAEVVLNSAIFKLWFSQTHLVTRAHQVLKSSLAILSAAHKIVSFLSMIAQLSSASLLSFVLQDVTLVSAQEQDMLLHLLPVVVRPALL